MALDLDARLTIAQAVMHLRQYPAARAITKGTINAWHARGHLPSTLLNKAGQREYVLRELLTAERDTRRHPNSSRSTARRTAA